MESRAAGEGGIGGSNGSSGGQEVAAQQKIATSPFTINIDDAGLSSNGQQNAPNEESSQNRRSSAIGYTTGVIQMNVHDRDSDNIKLRNGARKGKQSSD